MSSILPPAQRIWSKVPIGKEELVWITLSLIWCLIMFAMMPLWHFYGKQNMSNEAYKVPFSEYSQKVTEMVSAYQVGTEANLPIVHPPVGSDVYMYGGGFMWYPILELEKDQSYRLHLSSADVQHGFSLQPVNINLQVIPGYDMVVKITPDQAGDFHIICNEYCGIGHHQMLGKIIVKE